MTWVHGNELSWPIAFQKILPQITIDTGTVYFIIANPKALEKNIRYVEKNMNRCFSPIISGSSYEEERVQEIMPFLQEADYLLDIHNTTNPQSKAFLISEHQSVSCFFPIDTVISGIDLLHSWGSDGYMNSLNKIWLCIECWSISDAKAPIIAEQSIINFLQYTGNIAQAPRSFLGQTFICFDYIYTTVTDLFILTESFCDFDYIKKDQIIWYDGDIPISASIDSVILFAHNRKKKWEEAFVLWTIIS